jgi:hypothetical protein
VKTNYFKNCDGIDSVMKIEPNSGVKLSKDCEVVATGCCETEGFKTAEVDAIIITFTSQ